MFSAGKTNSCLQNTLQLTDAIFHYQSHDSFSNKANYNKKTVLPKNQKLPAKLLIRKKQASQGLPMKLVLTFQSDYFCLHKLLLRAS